MKKLGKLTLKQMENQMTVIGSDEQREGGGFAETTFIQWLTTIVAEASSALEIYTYPA